jgi:hypothetical protein
MDRDKVSPKNNRAGELYQGLIVPHFLFLPHQEFSEAVQPRMAEICFSPGEKNRGFS